MISLFKVNPKNKTDEQLWKLYSKSLEKWRETGHNIFGPVYEQLTAYSKELDERNIDKDLALTEEGNARWQGRPIDISRCKILPELKNARELFHRYNNVLSGNQHPLIEKVMDVTLLPASKEDIKQAILLLLKDEGSAVSNEKLEGAYVSLSEFQKDVGIEPIVTCVEKPIDDDEPPVPVELETFCPTDATNAWQSRVEDEYERLCEDLISSGHTALEKKYQSLYGHYE